VIRDEGFDRGGDRGIGHVGVHCRRRQVSRTDEAFDLAGSEPDHHAADALGSARAVSLHLGSGAGPLVLDVHVTGHS
jgi:hypothetical protein